MTWLPRMLGLSISAIGILVAGGCFSFSPAQKRAGKVDTQPAELSWPSPDAAPLLPIQHATPERVFAARMASGKAVEDVKDAPLRDLVTKPRYTIVRNEVIDGALVRMFKDETGEISLTSLFMGFVPNGYVLSARDVSPGRLKLALARDERSRKRVNGMWAGQGVESDPVDEEIALETGIAFSLPSGVPANCLGVVLHLWALANNEYERGVMEELSARGWFVIEIKPNTGAPADIRAEVVDTILALEDELAENAPRLPTMNKGESASAYQKRLTGSEAYRRQTEISARIQGLRNPPVPLCAASDVPHAAAELGRRIDAVLADNANASRVVLETAYRVHPALRGLPVVVVGFSAGAISAPTVAALVRPNAVVVIGGAANAVAIASRSELSRGGLRLGCEGKPPSPALIRQLETEYLNHSKLDPYHAAPLLAATPVLVIDAGMDTWVPSDCGQVLYERLGRPDRLHMSLGGHGMLFYFLPGRAGWIADWVGRAVGKVGHPGR